MFAVYQQQGFGFPALGQGSSPSSIEQAAATLAVALEDGTVPSGVVAMLRNFSAMDLALIAGRAMGLGANPALVQQAVEAAGGSTTTATAVRADPAAVQQLQQQINRFFVDTFGIPQQTAVTGVLDAETISRLPQAAQVAINIAGPLDFATIAALSPAASGMDAAAVAQNAGMIADVFSRIMIPAPEDTAIAEQAVIELINENIHPDQRPKVVAAAAQAAAQVKAQGGSTTDQQVAAKAAAQQAVKTTRKFFDLKNPKLWVAAAGGVALVVVVGATIKLLARRPAAVITRAAR